MWKPTTTAEKLAVSFVGVVIAIALATALFSLGRVELIVQVRAVPIRADFDVAVIGGVHRGDELAGRIVAIDGVATVERSVESVGDAVDLATLPPQQATGTVTLVNTHSVAQTLVATTRLLTPEGVLFRLDRSVAIPAGGRVEAVAVTADASGVHGNIGSSKFRIPGLSPWLQERIWAESASPMSGGQGTSDVAGAAKPVVTQEALDALKLAARDAARADFTRRVAEAVYAGEEATILEQSVVTETDVAVGDALASMSATAVASGRILILPRGALVERARAELEEAALVQGRTLLRVHEDTLAARVVVLEEGTGRATIAVTATGDARVGQTLEQFDVSRIVGFTPADVQTSLQSIPGVEGVEVRLWPFWVDTVPANGKVEVELREME